MKIKFNLVWIAFNTIFCSFVFANISSAQMPTEISNSLFKYQPLGELKSAVPPDCHPMIYRSNSLKNYQNPAQFSFDTRNFFKKCENYLTKGNIQNALGLVLYEKVDYKLLQSRYFQKTMIRLSNGTKLEAYIGIKDLTTKRPWVISKCGVFCDVTESPGSLSIAMNLFDQSPFNIILVSNHTGVKHIQNNASLLMGGYYEAYDFFEIAKWLKEKSDYQSIVDSVHVVGFSLGGAAALGVSYLNSFYASKNFSPLINSSMAICPVVNLEPTLHDLFSKTIKGRLFTQTTWDSLKEVAPYLEKAQDYLNQEEIPASDQFPDMLANISLRYGSDINFNSTPNFQPPSINSLKEYYSYNNFAHYKNAPEIPTLVWASHDDGVVSYNLNTKILNENTSKLNFSTLGVVDLPFGNHCAFDISYGYPMTTAVLQSFILNNSPQFKNQLIHKIEKIPSNTIFNFSTEEIHLRQWWEVKEGKRFIFLNFETFDPSVRYGIDNDIFCATELPFLSNRDCRKQYQVKLPSSVLNYSDDRLPLNSTEAQALTRKLNGLFRVTHESIPIDGTNNSPTDITLQF